MIGSNSIVISSTINSIVISVFIISVITIRISSVCIFLNTIIIYYSHYPYWYCSLWIQVPPKKILYPPNCTLSAFLAATWIHSITYQLVQELVHQHCFLFFLPISFDTWLSYMVIIYSPLDLWVSTRDLQGGLEARLTCVEWSIMSFRCHGLML